MVYRLTESDEKTTREITSICKDVVDTVNPKEVYNRALKRRKLVSKKLKIYEEHLMSLGIDINKAKDYIKGEVKGFSIKDIILTIKKYWKERVNVNVQNRGKAWSMFFYMLFAYMIFSSILYRLGVSKDQARYLLTIVGAPLIEEASRYYSIKAGITEDFWYVFNVMEFTQYVVIPFIGFIIGKVSIVTLGISLIVRFIAVMMHTFNTMVQKSELNKGNTSRGYLIGVLVHFIWNAILSPLAGNSYNLRSLAVSGIGGIGLLKLVGVIYEKILNKKESKAISTAPSPAYA